MDIISFTVSEEYYLGGIFNVDKSPHRLSKLKYENKAIIEKDSVFIRLLVKGKLSLYMLKDEKEKVHYFLENNNNEFTELTFRKYLKEQGYNKSSPLIVKDEAYKRILLTYMNDAPSLKSKIEDLEYLSKPLIKLFEKYNENTGNNYISHNYVNKIVLIPVIFTGLGFTSHKFNITSDTKTISEIDPQKSTYLGPSFGVGAKIMHTRKLQKLSLYFELKYQSQTNEYSYKLEERPNLYEIHKSIGTSHFMKYGFFVHYQLDLKDIKPYINTGFSLGFPIQSNCKNITEKHFYSQITTTENSVKYYTGSLIANLGINYKKLFIEFRFDKCVNNTTITSLHLGYNFGNKHISNKQAI